MLKLYIMDKFGWVIRGIFLSVGIMMLVDGIIWGLLLLVLAVITAHGAYRMDITKGYADAIYKHYLSRKGKGE